MSLTAFAAAMAPKSCGSSTIGVKKSTVATSARSGAIRYTAASSRSAAAASTLGSTIGGRAPRTCPSSRGLSLQAQPAPWLYSVNLSGESCSMRCSLSPRSRGRSGGGATFTAAMSLVFAAIAPHGGLAVEEACTAKESNLALQTRAGMLALGRAFDKARPEVVIVATPHNVHIGG